MMSQLKEDLREQANEAMKGTPDGGPVAEPVDISTQLRASQFNNRVDKIRSSRWDDSFIVKTPYGKIHLEPGFEDTYYRELVDSMCIPNEKVCDKYLKENNINVPASNHLYQNLTRYLAMQATSNYIEDNKSSMDNQEYQYCMSGIREDMSDCIRELNKDGLVVNVKTGNLEQVNMLAMNSRNQSR